MLPNQFLTREKARLMGKKFFKVDKTTNQLQLRADALSTLDKMKLYAVIQGNWLIALYPDDNGYMPIVQHLTDGKWVDNTTSTFAHAAPVQPMLLHLEHFYHKTWPLY